MRLKLHTKFIILLIGVSLVPLIAVSAFTLLRFQQSLRTDASALGEQLAATASAQIQTFLVSQFGVLDNIAAIYNPGFPIKKDVAAKILETILLKSDNFMDISVVDRDGKEIVRKNRLLIIPDSDVRDMSTSTAYRSVRERGVYVGPVYVENGRSFFNVGREVLGVDNAFAGAVFAQVDARIMPSVLEGVSHIVGPPGRVYIVNEKGIVIAHPDISYMLSERDLSSLPPIGSIVAHPDLVPPSSIYTNELGQSVLGAAYPMTILLSGKSRADSSSVNWFVVAEQPEARVYAGARRAALFSIFISLIGIILAAGAAFFFAGRIARPIEALHTAAIEFGRGNLGYRALVKTRDEIGDLAKSFNVMAESLAHSIDSLKAEEQIISAERNKLGVILSGITNAVIAVDLKGSVILFNTAAETLLGVTAQDVLGTLVGTRMRIFSGETELSVEEYCPLQTGDSEGPVFSRNDLRVRTPSGEERYVNLVSGHIREGVHSNLGCILTLQDITGEYAMEKTKREFVSIAAHQLRTPLTGITWALESLESVGATEADRGRAILAGARGAVRRMIGLVDDLLDVSRIEEGRFGIKMQKQSIEPLLQRAAETFKGPAEAKKLKFEISVQKPLPDVSIDENKMEMVMNNLIDNAIKYTSEGGVVRVEAKCERDALVISVSDNGIGIPKGEFDRVFTKFFRSQEALARFTDGSGLGLYVAKHIIDQHGGKIWFESSSSASAAPVDSDGRGKTTEGKEEAKGTIFFLSLPLPKTELSTDQNSPGVPKV